MPRKKLNKETFPLIMENNVNDSAEKITAPKQSDIMSQPTEHKTVDNVCPKCGGTRHIYNSEIKGYVRCECLNKFRATYRMNKAKIPFVEIESPDMLGEYKCKNNVLTALNFPNEEKHLTLILCGVTWLKNKLGSYIIRLLIERDSRDEGLIYGDLRELVDEEFRPNTHSGLAELKEVNLLLLKIGNETTNKAHKDYIFDLIESRTFAKMKTVVLSSHSMEQTYNLYGERFQSLVECEGILVLDINEKQID